MKNLSSIIKKTLAVTVAVISLFAISSLTSCRKVSHNGRLDGQWQVMTVENLVSSETVSPYPKIYYCFNLHVAQLTGTGGATGNLHYDKDDAEITIDFPYVKDLSGLANFGIHSNPVTMHIDRLNGKTLVLRTPESIITCRRF